MWNRSSPHRFSGGFCETRRSSCEKRADVINEDNSSELLNYSLAAYFSYRWCVKKLVKQPELPLAPKTLRDVPELLLYRQFSLLFYY